MWKPDPWTAVRELARWHVTTQVGARRNALFACALLAQRRREHDVVESILTQVNAGVDGTVLSGRRERQTPMSL